MSANETVSELYDILDTRGIVAPCYLNPHRGNPRAHLFNDLHLDSLDLIELDQAISEVFDVDLPDDAVIETVGDLAKLIDQKSAGTK